MAKKVRGHRANKANDSFGTINNDNLYKGKYREEVYEDDDDGVEAQSDADPEEVSATQQDEAGDSFVQTKTEEPEESHDYKKRYDDLKRHYDAKVNEFKQEIDDLKSAVRSRDVEMPNSIAMPKTVEELQAFKEQYPDIFEVVQTVSAMQAQSQVSQLQEEIGVIKEREKSMEKQKAYAELLRLHPDFDEIKADEDFLSWLDEQPESLSDGIYKNNTNARLAARVIDLYKADKGISEKPKRTKSKNDDAAAAVTRQAPKELSTRDGKGKIWKASQIGKMKPWEFEKHEAELDAARAEGRIDYNS
jgi:predicted  nucleic acid-binding Zn-ribbon protein